MSAPPLPVPPDSTEETDHRLWIGNLDSRLTEFSILKILQKFGSLKKFDFLYHKSGPDMGKPRGYCFASYENKESAELALAKINGKLALSKRLIVRWANKEPSALEPEKSKLTKSVNIEEDVYTSPQSKIHAIEAKLQKMQEEKSSSPEVKPVPGSSELSVVQREARLREMELASARRQTKRPYKR
uniref:Probable RNA-binding protein 18 n=1 Tax=Crassostrea virginica TaxID=6565 RepID=A0A8B8D626_CRAVI|nr:probable RNA-binding protein 18 [Crassostrea virginica]